MNATVNVLDSVIDNAMGVCSGKALIGEQGVSVESGTRFDMLFDFSLQCRLAAIRNHGRANLATTLQDAHDSRLVLRARACDAPRPLVDVHVAGLAPDESFVSLDFARELDGRVVMHDGTNAVEHEPCRLLRHTDGAMEFVAGNTVLAVANHPDRHHPLIQPERAVLEDSSDFEAELLIAPVAHPDATGFDEGMLLGTAARASNFAVRKPKIQRVLESAVCVAEVNDSLLKSVRRFHE